MVVGRGHGEEMRKEKWGKMKMSLIHSAVPWGPALTQGWYEEHRKTCKVRPESLAVPLGCPFSPVSLQPLRALHGRALLSALTNPHVPSMQVSGSLPLLSCLLKLIRLLQAKVLIAKNVLTPKSILSKMVHLKKRRKDQTQPSRT